MKILHVSDIHGNRWAIKRVAEKAKTLNVDFVVISGDVTNFGTLEEAKRILRAIRETSGKRIFFVPGNCDPPELIDFSEPPEIVNLHLRIHEERGVFLAGIGGCPISPFNTLFEWREEDMMREALSTFKDVPSPWILVSHSPPKGTKVAVTKVGVDAGSKVVRRLVDELKPKLVLTGHIHEGRGIVRLGKTLIVNPGPAKAGYAAIVSFDSAELLEL